MTLEEKIKRNDFFRTTLSGGRIEMLPPVKELPPRIRGRLIYRLSLFNSFHPESDHSNGAFIFAGWKTFFGKYTTN